MGEPEHRILGNQFKFFLDKPWCKKMAQGDRGKGEDQWTELVRRKASLHLPEQ